MVNKESTTYVVIPNFNSSDRIQACLQSLRSQSLEHNVVVVDNASHDNSVELIEAGFPEAALLKNKHNLGFAGGVNTGINYALSKNATYIALLNDDAVADKDWLENLVKKANEDEKIGIVTPKILSKNAADIDSVGEGYSIWGLPFPTGRGEKDKSQYKVSRQIFGASGGASLYRVKMLREVGLFDKDFFAYYEDVDLSFRAQLSGWEILYEPAAIVHHATGSTSKTIKGFTTYQTIKNLPWLFWKNVPRQYLLKIGPRFFLAHTSFIFAAFARGQFWPAIKGLLVSLIKLPKKLWQRHKIQKSKKVSVDYIGSLFLYDLPPDTARLRKIRSILRLKY